MSHHIDWEKSFFLTKEEVATLGLNEKSVLELDEPQQAGPLARAMEQLTVTDIGRWAEEMEIITRKDNNE